MNTGTAPETTWDVRVRWGERQLTAEVLDARGRKTLSLGDTREDDVHVGQPVRIAFEWTEAGLAVRFTSGVQGTLARQGDAARSLSELLQTGLVKEAGAQWEMTLSGSDVLRLRIGTLTVEARRGRGRFVRLPFDPQVLVLVVLALLAVGLVWLSIAAPAEGPRLQWLKRPPP